MYMLGSPCLGLVVMGMYWGELDKNSEGPGSALCKVRVSAPAHSGPPGRPGSSWWNEKGRWEAGQPTDCFLCGKRLNQITRKDGPHVTVLLTNPATLSWPSVRVFWKKAHQWWPAAALFYKVLARNPMKMVASPQMSSDSHLVSVTTQFGSILQFRSGEASSSFLLFPCLQWHSRKSGRRSRQTLLGKTPDSEDFLHRTWVQIGMTLSLLNTYYVLGVTLGFGATAGPYS